MKKLKISKEVSLRLEAVTQTFAILAVKGSGKSYTASVMSEEMLKANEQIVVIDPTGAWWGLQSSADGKSEGFPVVIFGGDHSNVPLEENTGEIIAQAIVEQHFSAIIDLSLFRKNQSNRFVGIFLETLFRINRQPIHLFVDEADAFAPQKVYGDQAKTVGAMEDIVRRGRKKGIGCSLITQRPSSINKDVLTQCEILIALRMSHPRDIDAISEWVNVHATAKEAKDMIADLPQMQKGQAYIWSPSWLRIFKKVQIRLRETFDSGATPEPGKKIIPPKKLAKIDIKELGEKITETVERKKADDPAELKKKIKSLENLLNKKDGLKSNASDESLQKLNSDLIASEKSRLQYFTVISNLHNTIESYEKIFAKITAMVIPLPVTDIPKKFEEISKLNIRLKDILFSKSERSLKPYPGPKSAFIQSSTNGLSNSELKKETPSDYLQKQSFSNHENSDKSIGKCERAILIVLAQRNGKLSSRNQIGILSGYSPTSGGFNNSISSLRQKGFLEGNGDGLEITELGLNALNELGKYETIPVGEELHRYWINKLGKCEGTILEFLINHHPSFYTKENIGVATNYSPTSGGFNNALSRLNTLELIEKSGSVIKASDSLFE